MKKRIFVHIPKNGGMSIRRHPEISKQILVATPDNHISKEYTRDLHLKMKETNDHHGNEHCPIRFWRKDLVKNHKAFAIVRNPWDRVVSRYFFAKKVIEVEKTSSVYGRTEYADVSSFEAFLDERFKWGGQSYMWHRAIRGWFPAYYHVDDGFGNINVDIMRFENYDDDVKAYFGLLTGINPRNVTNINKGSYRDVYTPQTIQIVADWYKQDIDHWGFDFETGATKNTYWSN